MASKDSDELAWGSGYNLGDYSFRLERSSVPGSTNDKIEAICTDKDGKNARKSIQLPSTTKMGGWYVEANETEATVYALVQIPIGDERTSPFIPDGIPCGNTLNFNRNINLGKADVTYTTSGSLVTIAHMIPGYYAFRTIFASPTSGTIGSIDYTPTRGEATHEDVSTDGSYTYDGRTVYYKEYSEVAGYNINSISGPVISTMPADVEKVAWTIIYGTPSGDEYETKEIMVGRFAIDLGDAGGEGPGSDWDDPEDYDDDWEEGDPTHTLYVTVTGALSGRHNDPIEDPSYSYIPADKDTVKDYGCGGDGGHGGGGGAGASTVVIHKFATDQANSKEVTAIARRHGYGSGGGKGGKGGDGCILVYYGNGASPGPEPVIQPIVANLSVNKASAAIDEVITWTLSATGGNGNYQYSFTLLDSNNQQVHSTGWQIGSSFSYSLQTEGTYHVAGYVRDSRETDTAQAPQSGIVQVSGSEPTPTPTPTGNAESQYNIYDISWTGIATSGEGPEPTPTPEGNVQSQYNISELSWSSKAMGDEEPEPEPIPTPDEDVISQFDMSDLSWNVTFN